MDPELKEEVDEYINEVMPMLVSAMLQNEIIQKQMAVQERVATALEKLVELKEEERVKHRD